MDEKLKVHEYVYYSESVGSWVLNYGLVRSFTNFYQSSSAAKFFNVFVYNSVSPTSTLFLLFHL